MGWGVGWCGRGWGAVTGREGEGTEGRGDTRSEAGKGGMLGLGGREAAAGREFGEPTGCACVRGGWKQLWRWARGPRARSRHSTGARRPRHPDSWRASAKAPTGGSGKTAKAGGTLQERVRGTSPGRTRWRKGARTPTRWTAPAGPILSSGSAMRLQLCPRSI